MEIILCSSAFIFDFRSSVFGLENIGNSEEIRHADISFSNFDIICVLTLGNEELLDSSKLFLIEAVSSGKQNSG